MQESKTKMYGSNCWFDQIAQETQRSCPNVVTASEDWFYRHVQFDGKESFAEIS